MNKWKSKLLNTLQILGEKSDLDIREKIAKRKESKKAQKISKL